MVSTARALTTVGPGHRSVPDPAVGLHGLPEHLCRASHATAPSTGPCAPRHPVAQRDPDVGYANSRAQHDANHGPTGRLTVGPSTATHRNSRSGPRTCRAAPSAITPSRVSARFPCETAFEAVKDPPRNPRLVSPSVGGQFTGSQAGTHECRYDRHGDPNFYSGPSSALPGHPGVT